MPLNSLKGMRSRNPRSRSHRRYGPRTATSQQLIADRFARLGLITKPANVSDIVWRLSSGGRHPVAEVCSLRGERKSPRRRASTWHASTSLERFRAKACPDLIRGGYRFACRKRVKTRIQNPVPILSERKRL